VNRCELFNGANDAETIKNKKRYTSIVRAQLSQFELGMLFYNGVSKYGNEDFKPMIETYGLLENFNQDSLADPEHEKFYEGGAYE
jgi:hypothetical protein